MSYETGTPSSVEDLIQKLFTFATGTPGWTQELLDTTNDIAVLSKTGVGSPAPELVVSFKWGFTGDDWLRIMGSTAVGSPVSDPASYPGRELDGTEFDSTSDSIGKMVQFVSSGPYQSYWFFEDDNYIHVVVEIETNKFRHFHFGQATLYGDIGGSGLYTTGHYWNQSTSAIDLPESTTHSVPFDGLSLSRLRNATAIQMSHPDLAPVVSPQTQWYFDYQAATITGVDGDGIDIQRIQCSGSRVRMDPQLIQIGTGRYNGFKPLFPIQIYTRDTGAAPDIYQLCAGIPDVRAVNLRNLSPKQEVTIGSDTWTMFPLGVQKESAGDDTEQTLNWGLAYKKVTT